MKACNLCKKFKGFGLHWLAGTCFKHEEIPMFSYKEFAESCDDYDSDFVSCCDNCIFTGCSDRSDYITACSKKLSFTNPNLCCVSKK